MIESIGKREFRSVAESVAEYIARAQESGDFITVDDLKQITNGNGFSVNMYPSNHKGFCCEVAYVISLNSTKYAKSSGHLKFRKALEKLVQHTQGTCAGVTEAAVLITDSWDANAFDDWRGNIEQIQRQIYLEVYLVTNSRISLQPI